MWRRPFQLECSRSNATEAAARFPEITSVRSALDRVRSGFLSIETVKGGRFPMKLALYLPNFRDKVTVSEIVDLAHLAEELEFDSVWTLDRIVVPEASDRQELRKPFGFMKEFPLALPVASRGEFLHGLPLFPYLAAITKKRRVAVTPTNPPSLSPRLL